MTDVEALQQKIKEAHSEIEDLKLRLSNLTLLLRKEMQLSGKLPKEPDDGGLSN